MLSETSQFVRKYGKCPAPISNRRKEYFALFSAEDISATHKRVLERDGVAAFDIKRLLSD